MKLSSRMSEAAIEELRDPARRITAPVAKQAKTLPRLPGLYAWWIDESGAAAVNETLDMGAQASLIYAGQAGATRWPSGKRSPATLASRIATGHLGNSIDGSTFRLTLAAILSKQLGLEMRSPKYLTNASEALLTAWMLEHLAVSVHEVADGDILSELEAEVLRKMDPPLNLDGMPPSSVRERLSRSRKDLRTQGASRTDGRAQRIGLIGCVKTKRASIAPAADLYLSPLFRGRRRAVEATCDRWFILSAKHGLVDPSRRLAPYDTTLTRASASERRRWAERVLKQLDAELGAVAGSTFEIHAGSAYVDWGLVSGLHGRGARVVRPTEGLGMGKQLALYRNA